MRRAVVLPSLTTCAVVALVGCARTNTADGAAGSGSSAPAAEACLSPEVAEELPVTSRVGEPVGGGGGTLVDDLAGGHWRAGAWSRRFQVIEHVDADGEVIAWGELYGPRPTLLAGADGALWVLVLEQQSRVEPEPASLFGLDLGALERAHVSVVRLSATGEPTLVRQLEAEAMTASYSSTTGITLISTAASASGELLVQLATHGVLEVDGARFSGSPTEGVLVTVRLDADGEVVWARETVGGEVALFEDGSSAIGSRYRDGSGERGVGVVRLDAAGGVVAEVHYPTEIAADVATVHALESGDVLLAGTLRAEVELGRTTLAPLGRARDLMLLRFDEDLDLIFARRYGGPGEETIEGAYLDAGGRLVLFGGFVYEADLGGPLLRAWPPSETGTRSYRDGFVLRLSADGEHQGSVGLGSEGEETVRSAIARADGTVLATLWPGGQVQAPFAPEPQVTREVAPAELSGEHRRSFGTTLSADGELVAVGGYGRVDVFRRDGASGYAHVGQVERDPGTTIARFLLHDATLYVTRDGGLYAHEVGEAGLGDAREVALSPIGARGLPSGVSALAVADGRLLVGSTFGVHVLRLPRLDVEQVIEVPGAIVAADGDVLLAAFPGHRGPREQSGAVEVFVRRRGRYVQTQTLEASDAAPAGPDWPVTCGVHTCEGGGPMLGERFGQLLAFDGDLLLVGADSSRFYVYERQGDRFVERQRFHDDDGLEVPVDAGRTGTARWAPAFDAGRLALGNMTAYRGPLQNAGEVYLLRWDGERMVPETSLRAPQPLEGGAFGAAVAFDGDALLVGAAGEGRFGTVRRIELCR